MDPDRRAEMFRRVERLTEAPMLVLAVAFVALVFLPEVVELSERAHEAVEGLLWLVWGVFAIELGVKTYLAPDRRRFLLTHWPDVLTVAFPFLRPLRLLRVFIVLARAWRQTRSVLRQRTLSLVGITSLLTVLGAAGLLYAVERHTDGPIKTFPDALWWAVTTITTVGYGDMYPTTALGRGVAVFLMVTGITLFGLLTASVAAFFVESDAEKTENAVLEEIRLRLARLEQQLEAGGARRRPRLRTYRRRSQAPRV